MYAFFFILLFFNSNVFPPIGAQASGRGLNETQKEALRGLARRVLNLDFPEPVGKTAGSASRDAQGTILSRAGAKLNGTKRISGNEKNNKFPRHMLELMEKHSFQEAVSGEIIRSIEPMKDFVPHFKDILVFNVSGLSRTEKIRSAHLHIHRRRLSPPRKAAAPRAKVLPPPCRVRLYQLLTGGPSGLPHASGDDRELSEMERTKLRSLDSVLVTQVTRGGWHSLEISMALKEMLNSPAASPAAIFGVRFEGPRGKSITAQHFLKETGDSMPSSFIMMYSEDNMTYDEKMHESSSAKLSSQQMQIIAELLEITPKYKIASKNSNGSGDKTEATLSQHDNFHIFDKSQQIKKKINKIKTFDADPIRHQKKYYRENRALGSATNDALNNNAVQKTKMHRVMSPGNGDIIELLDFDTVRKVNKLRRHNHKTINSLSLRYDTATKHVIQKKLGKSRYANTKSDEYYKNRNEFLSADPPRDRHTEVPGSNIFITRNSNDNTRLRRSAPDESGVEQDYEYSKVNGNVNVDSEKYEIKPNKEKEFETEDDMGDLSFDFNANKKSKINSKQKKLNALSNRNKNGYFIYEIDPETEYDETEHNYIDENVGKHSQHFLDASWADKNVEEANGLQSKAGRETYSIEKDESVSDEKWSDSIQAGRGAEKRRHKNLKSRRRPGAVRAGEAGYPGNDRDEGGGNEKAPRVNNTCHHYKLSLNFTELGWEEMILPETFEIGFCLGVCPTSAISKQNDTNHNILQSIARAIYRQDNTPEACCTADKTSSVTLLLNYPSGDIRLQSFRDMSAKTCKCR